MNVSPYVHTWVYLSRVIHVYNKWMSLHTSIPECIYQCYSCKQWTNISIPECISRCHSCEQQTNDSPLVLGSLDRTWWWISDGCWLVSHPATASLQTSCSRHVISNYSPRMMPSNNIHSVASPAMGHWGTCSPSTSNNFIFSSLLVNLNANYPSMVQSARVACADVNNSHSISTALVTKLLVIKRLLRPTLKSAVSAPWPNF